MDLPVPNSKALCGLPLSEAPGVPDSSEPWCASTGRRLAAATRGRFEIVEPLAQGGGGCVFLAREIALDRKVAIKVLGPWLQTSDDNTIARFKREAVTMAGLTHPNIVRVHRVEYVEDLSYFVMDFVGGRSLEFILDCVGVLPIHLVQAILYDVGAALGYAHRHQIIHRDIKPGNIMIDGNGSAILMDFGIAKQQHDKAGLTRAGALVGTVAYMSPEQCSKDPLTVSSDQYSLGVVAYEALTGRPPFSGSQSAVIHGHISKSPTPIEELRPDCPRALSAAIARMLSKDPRARFPELTDALAALGARPLTEADPYRRQLARLAAIPPNARPDARPTPSRLARTFRQTPGAMRLRHVVLGVVAALRRVASKTADAVGRRSR